MEKEPLSPFNTGPRTVIEKDDQGREIYRVELRAIGPRFKRLANGLSLVGGVATAIGAAYTAIQLNEASAWQYWSLALSPAVTFLGCKFGLHEAFKCTRRVVFTPDRFIVKKLFGERVYNRDIPHKFAFYSHRLSEREEQVLSHRERIRGHRWWNRPRTRYFGKTYVLSYEYMGQRNDIMSIYGEKDAQVILGGLNARDQAMDASALSGHGQALSPEGDWPEQSGDLQAI